MSNSAKACTDPVVGAILSGWRYDISSISPEMRTDYEKPPGRVLWQCRHRQTRSLVQSTCCFMLAMTSLSIVSLSCLQAWCLHRIEMFRDIPAVHMRLHQMPATISLWAVVIVGSPCLDSSSGSLWPWQPRRPGFLGDVVH